MSISNGILTNINRERALNAYGAVERFLEEESDKQIIKDFKTRSRKLPTMIHNNGLSETLFFFKSKAKESDESEPNDNDNNVKRKKNVAYKLIYNIMEKWLSQYIDIKDTFLLSLIKAERDKYIFLTHEAMEYASWLKRAAEAMIDE